MPISIPTALVARFVSTAPLHRRIKALQTSYKIQYSGFMIFSFANMVTNVPKLMVVAI
tara:strand:+ start:422 stop:595 length:174 start_codon:yes stop_codon:yes gene_type:complete